MVLYIKNITEFTYEIEKSKFISILFECKNSEDLQGFLQFAKEKYPKARHYCYAIRCEECSRNSDDGEPSGTAGKPLLDLLNKNNLMNTGIIVVRYFGGIKLGAGRLLRSYVTSAKENIDSATKYIREECLEYELLVDISKANEFKNFCALNGYTINKLIYNSIDVSFNVSSSTDITKDLEERNIKIIKKKQSYKFKEN